MKPKIRRKDYESKSDYLDALLAYYWWQTLLIFSVVTALMTLLASLIVARAYIIFTLLYTLFCVMFIFNIICEKNKMDINAYLLLLQHFVFFQSLLL